MNWDKTKEYIHIYSKLLEFGAVIYGAGKNGKYVFDFLKNHDIEVNSVGDKIIGKQIGNLYSISLQDLCARDCSEICIVTPNKMLVQEEIEILKTKFQLVIDNIIMGEVINWFEYNFPICEGEMNYKESHPFNCYDSPFSTYKEKEYNKQFVDNDKLLDIDLNIDVQKDFLPRLLKRGQEFWKKYDANNKQFRYLPGNSMFNDSDATLLHSVMMEYKPKQIIEIGSGFSTCMMLDTNEFWLNNNVDITCIEPYPARLKNNIKDTDNIRLKEEFVQNVSLREFENLEENSILFIDSSHVVKAGGDIPYEYFEILPRLKAGVIVHIHDIFSAFSYPQKWIENGRCYTEGFLLRALLMNNNRYKIIYFNNSMSMKYQNDYLNAWGGSHVGQIVGGSIWLKVCCE